MRFFRNAAGKKLPNELLESVRHMHFSLMWSVFRAHAQKDVFEEAMFEQKRFKRGRPMFLK